MSGRWPALEGQAPNIFLTICCYDSLQESPASALRVGQSGTDDALHLAANWLRTRSSFFKSRIFARMPATCCSVKALTSAQVRC